MKAAKTRALNAKHAGTRKHTGTAKHTPTAHKKTATAAKQTARRTASQTKAARARALGCVSSCSAEALAMSLRLSGWPVAPEDVLDLYRHTADSPTAGATIPATLEAALAFGLAGVRPVSFELTDRLFERFGEGGGEADDGRAAIDLGRAGEAGVLHGASVILGLDLPEGPHAVCLDPSGGVWSWGALHEMTSEAVIEEAWAVIWP